MHWNLLCIRRYSPLVEVHHFLYVHEESPEELCGRRGAEVVAEFGDEVDSILALLIGHDEFSLCGRLSLFLQCF